MNSSYNYADFIGLNLYKSSQNKSGIDSKVKHKGKKRSSVKGNARLGDEARKEKTAG